MANEDQEPCIGIDLGTTYSCVAVFRGKAGVEVLANEHGDRTTPSFVAFQENQTFIGKPAKAQAASNPKHTIFDVKRLIGRKFTDPTVTKDRKHWPFGVIEDNGNPNIVLDIPKEKKTFLPEQISGMILGYMKEIASKYLGKDVKKAVITVPAYFNDAQRDATKRAGEIAQLEVMRIVNEPTAAGIAYGFRNKEEKKKNILVFDLGGGTFDVSILTIEKGIYEVIATAGDSHLGGEDFDNNIVDYFIDLLKTKYNIDISNNVKAKIRLRAKCEEGKRNLVQNTETRIIVDSLMPDFDLNEKFSRHKFDELNQDLYKMLRHPIESALNDASLEKENIDNVVLIGGSSRILYVQNMIKELFPKKVRQDINNDEAVAYGAAIVAAHLNGEKHEQLQDFYFNDVTSLSLGLETVGGEMAFFIQRNKPLPQTETRWFTTNRDSQSSVCFVVYEGERLIAKENNRLGEFVISGIETGKRDSIQIKVTLTINLNGVLDVSATESLTGTSNNLKIENVGRLSEVEVRKMVQDAIKFREDDAKEKERIEARLSLEDYCNTTLYRLRNNPGENVITKCKSVLQWVADNEDAETEDYRNKLKEIKHLCGPILERLFKK